jgi:hypothetical protein
MERWQENRTLALEILTRRNPDAYEARYQELLRGGLSASSIPEGARSSEKPLPGFDNFDVHLQHDRRGYAQAWVEVIAIARRLESYENACCSSWGSTSRRMMPTTRGHTAKR